MRERSAPATRLSFVARHSLRGLRADGEPRFADPEHPDFEVVTQVGSGINRSRAMPTRPYRILSRNLDQRLGAEAAWNRAVEIIRKSALGRDASQVLMRALMR